MSRLAFGLAVSLCLGIFVGCDDARKVIVEKMSNTTAERQAKVRQSLQRALTTSTNAQVLAWQEVLTQWPLATPRRGFAWDADLEKFDGNVSAGTLIEDRYVFKVILDFEMSSNFEKTTFSKLRFQFTEVKRVILPPEGAAEGGVDTLFQPDTKWFGLKEWRQLVESNWNFSAIGITVVSNAPIQNIKAILRQL